MGLGRDILRELAVLKQAQAFGSRPHVVEIGAQQLSNDFLRADQELHELFRLFGRSSVPDLGAPVGEAHVAGLEIQSPEAPASQPFWEALGFEYAAIDFDGHRHSRALDLNQDDVPNEWRNRFDLVINAGTTEHVANQANAFRVIHDLARKGGIMLHDVPAAGMLTHGLVTYTIKFFWHLCRDNAYQVLRLEMMPGDAAPMPDSVVAANKGLGRHGHAANLSSEPIRDWNIAATLAKPHRKAFATPLDLPPELAQSVSSNAARRADAPSVARRGGGGRIVQRLTHALRYRDATPVASAVCAPPDAAGPDGSDGVLPASEPPPQPVAAEQTLLVQRDFRGVINRLGFHPFIFLRLDDSGDFESSFRICRTQNDVAAFVQELEQIPDFADARLVRGLTQALQHNIAAAADLLFAWAIAQPDGYTEMVHVGQPALIQVPAFFGYPAFSFTRRRAEEGFGDRLAALTAAFEAYAATSGNDAMRQALMQAFGLAVARSLRLSGRPEAATAFAARTRTPMEQPETISGAFN